MADFDFGDGLRKVFLAGVGALATTAEKSQEIVNDLVKKGELTVEQGKTFNAELKHSVKEAAAKARNGENKAADAGADSADADSGAAGGSDTAGK